MPLSTTNKALYIVALEEPFDRIEIQFYPDSITVPREAKISKIAVVGRNNNLLQYTGGSETLSLPLQFYADKEVEVYQTVNWLKGLTMKDGNKGQFRRVKIVFGDLFKNEIWVLKSVNPEYKMFDDTVGNLPLMAKVDLQFILDPETNLLIDDMKSR